MPLPEPYSEEELSEDFKDGVLAVLFMMSKQPTITAQPEKCTEERTETHACDNISRQPSSSCGHENDTISRQAAISLPPKPREDRYFQTQNLDDAYDYGWRDLQRCIEKLPPAQQGRKTGTWIAVDYFAEGKLAYREWKCSACGCVAEDEKPTGNFCPMCGADMRKRMKIIDAEELIAKAKHEAEGMAEPFKSNFAVLVEWLIDKVQPIEPELHWIPWSERLPEENMWTICQNNAGAMMIGKYDIEFGWTFPAYFDGIVAWMPLPEPYKEGTGD